MLAILLILLKNYILFYLVLSFLYHPLCLYQTVYSIYKRVLFSSCKRIPNNNFITIWIQLKFMFFSLSCVNISSILLIICWLLSKIDSTIITPFNLYNEKYYLLSLYYKKDIFSYFLIYLLYLYKKIFHYKSIFTIINI